MHYRTRYISEQGMKIDWGMRGEIAQKPRHSHTEPLSSLPVALCTFFGREYSVNKSSMCQPNKQNIQFFCSLTFPLFLSAVDEFIGYSRSVLQAKCKRVLFFLCTFILYTCISVCWMCRSLVGWSGIQHIFENRMLNKLLVCQNKSISFATSIQFHSTITFLYLYMFHCDPVSKTLSISRYISFSLLSFKSASTPCI